MKDSHSAAYKIITAITASVIIFITTLYLLWSLVVEPNNEKALNQHIVNNLQSYQQKVRQYLQQQDAIVTQAIAETINEQLVFELDAVAGTLTEKILRKGIKPVELSILSKDDVDRYSELVVSDSFLTIDMLNRLQANKPIFWEAAKNPQKRKWQLNKLFPVIYENQLLGVIFLGLTLDGLYAIFSEDQLEGNITLSQSVVYEKPFVFFSMGNIESDVLGRTRSISDSFWQIRYKPSATLKTHYDKAPLWLWGTGIVLLIFLMAVSYFATRKVQPTTTSVAVRKPQAQKPKASAQPVKETARQQKSTKDSKEISIDDTIFRAYDIRGIVGEQLSADVFYAIGQSVATEALAAGETALLVGHDSRTHSPEFAEKLIEGIVSTGCDSIDIGLVPTPLLNFTAIHHAETSSGIVVTASHNPKEYNGCKMVIDGNTLVDEDIQRLKHRIKKKEWVSAPIRGKKSAANFDQEYISSITSDLVVMDGWKVVVDGANGAAGQLATDLFTALQCQLNTLFCEFDGKFPNHDPDPSVEENLQDLIKKVKEEKADVGFAFDGDGDRLVVITPQGRILWPDQLMMIFAQDIVARHPGCDVVYDIKSSAALGQLISEYGGRPVLWKTGHSHIKAKMRETGALLGGEFSGHIFFKERWFGFDDGLYAAARLLEIMTLTGQNLDKLLSDLPKKVATPEIKIAIDEKQKFDFMDKLMNHSDISKIDGDRTTIDGLRIDFEKAWGLIRASNTAPALTLRFEADNEVELNRVKDQFKTLLKKVNKDLPLDF